MGLKKAVSTRMERRRQIGKMILKIQSQQLWAGIKDKGASKLIPGFLV